LSWMWLGLAAVGAWGFYNWGKEAQQEAERERKRQQEREYLLDGALMPVAASLYTGDYTPEQADREVVELDSWRKGVWSRWRAMTPEARMEMGKLTLEIYADPAFRERQHKLIAGIDEVIGWKRS